MGHGTETGMLSAVSACRVVVSSPRNSNVVGEMLKHLSPHYPRTMVGGYSGPGAQDMDLFLTY